MSTISGYGESSSYYDVPEELPPGSDNPVENAGYPPEVEAEPASEDTSRSDWGDGLDDAITDNVTSGNFVGNTVFND